MNMIKVELLSKNYKYVEAVCGISFEVEKGSVYGLIGLNGAGKTTTIKAITGLLKNFEGYIEIAGTELGDKGYNKNFAFLPELFIPQAYLTGMEYIKFMHSLLGSKVDKEKIYSICESLNFDKELLDKKTATYSKGTIQKLGLIEVVTNDSEVLILDEPMSGLDPLARSRLKAVVEEAKNEGRTVLLSSHILHDMDIMCSHIGVLDSGLLLFDGTPGEFKRKNSAANLEEAFLKEITP